MVGFSLTATCWVVEQAVVITSTAASNHAVLMRSTAFRVHVVDASGPITAGGECLLRPDSTSAQGGRPTVPDPPGIVHATRRVFEQCCTLVAGAGARVPGTHTTRGLRSTTRRPSV